jgi:hypothetical protein
MAKALHFAALKPKEGEWVIRDPGNYKVWSAVGHFKPNAVYRTNGCNADAALQH